MERAELIYNLARMLLEVEIDHPLRVAIDGVDASGKTTLADELAEVMHGVHRQIIRASVDDFHNTQHIRRRRGDLSPEGFYHDSYQNDALIKDLLDPFGPDNHRRYRTAVFDHRKDQPVDCPLKTAPQDAILLMDGIFLLRPLLRPYWDLTIYLTADFTHTMARGIERDAQIYSSRKKAATRYQQRYIPGQEIYHNEAQPLDKADILIDNNILETPKFLRVRPHLQPFIKHCLA